MPQAKEARDECDVNDAEQRPQGKGQRDFSRHPDLAMCSLHNKTVCFNKASLLKASNLKTRLSSFDPGRKPWVAKRVIGLNLAAGLRPTPSLVRATRRLA